MPSEINRFNGLCNISQAVETAFQLLAVDAPGCSHGVIAIPSAHQRVV
jgi:hypothetical protein